MTSTRLYLRLLGYIKPYWQAFAISILGMVVTAATEPLYGMGTASLMQLP